jgi:hypothetical protein
MQLFILVLYLSTFFANIEGNLVCTFCTTATMAVVILSFKKVIPRIRARFTASVKHVIQQNMVRRNVWDDFSTVGDCLIACVAELTKRHSSAGW